jgi:Uma2 family endonuclease
MPATETKRKLTVKDYMLPEEGAPFQLINNNWVKLPPPSVTHQRISARIIQIIYNFLDRINDTGVFAAGPIDVKFDDGNILHPDIFYVSHKRKSEIIKERIEGSPDLIIEIISMQSAYYDMRQKKYIYEKHGVKEYIIIDTIGLKAELYTLKEGVYQLNQKVDEEGSLESLLLPGCILDLNKIFKF